MEKEIIKSKAYKFIDFLWTNRKADSWLRINEIMRNCVNIAIESNLEFEENDLIEINTMCNTILRPDQIAYIMGHVELITDVNGKEKKVLSVIGKKSKRQMPEGFYPICLFTNVESDGDGNNTFCFETRANQSSAKSPISMFNDFLIPNSLKLVDDTIRAYYRM